MAEKLSYRKLDWILVGIYLILVIFGWMNIYSSSSEMTDASFSIKSKYAMHLIWMASAFTIALLIITVIPQKIYISISWPLYALVCFMLVAVAFLGVEVNGSKSWFEFGPVRVQPAEFSKISMSLLLAYIMSKYDYSFANKRDILRTAAVLVMPMLFILMEKETGSALVYLGFLLVLFRQGMSGWILGIGGLAVLLFILTLVFSTTTAVLVLMGILLVIWVIYAKKNQLIILFSGAAVITLLAFLPKLYESLAPRFEFITRYECQIWLAALIVPSALITVAVALIKRNPVLRNIFLGLLLGMAMIFSVEFVFENILKDHQRARIEVLLGLKEDPMGVGYNVHQSLIAIGSGGLLGKGFLGGTQTRFNFVPEQSTDFIFCTIGEEWGFAGTLSILILYFALIVRLYSSAEKKKDKFTRIYGYCVASCILMHVLINISMTIGLMPVIGIPLPFLSYGGSSLWAFTILLFIYIRLDWEQWK